MNLKRMLMILAALVTVGGSLWGYVAFGGAFSDWRWPNEPVHSATEAFGAMCAILVGIMMLQGRSKLEGKRLYFPALGFVAMGVLDGFHAICSPGQTFVFLHSASGLAGSIGFAMVWLSRSGGGTEKTLRAAWIVAAAAVLLGIWSLVLPATLPEMVRDGEFTNAALGINLLAGVLFLSSSPFFCRGFYRSGKAEGFLFLWLALFFGVAGLVFNYSALWDFQWWLWHALRLIGFLLALGLLYLANQKSRRELRESLDVRTVMDSLDALVYVADFDSYEILFINKYGREIWGDVTGEICWKSLQSDQTGPCEFCTSECLVDADGQPTGIYRPEFQNMANDRWYDCRDQVIPWLDGRLVRMEIATDITKRKQAEEALQKERATAQEYLDVAGVMMLALNAKGEIILCNKKGCDILGYEESEIIGRNWFSTCLPSNIADEVQGVFAQLMAGQVESVEFYDNPVVTASGEHRIISFYNTILRDESSKITGILSSGEDITERKRAEEERERLIVELESQNAELERFTYTVSHDLRSPLVTISGFLGMLKQDAMAGNAEAMEEDVTSISKATQKMEQLLDELLDLSRIGRQVNPPSEISLADLAQEVVSTTSVKLAGRGIQVEISPDLPVVFGDRLRLWEVLQNLVDNAAKFMGDQPDPRIEIGSRRDAEETVCYVRDNGMGIDPAYHEKVFGLFDRLDPKSEGTGVGLAIVKRIVEVHGGRIWVESEGPGQGSTFCFTVPRKGEETSQ